jgi:hypothetical protein
MHTTLLSIAAAVALAFAGAAQAQPTSSSATDATKPSVDRKVRKAEEDRIDAEYKADKAKCKDMKGNEKEACEADAKGKEKVAKAELKAKYDPTPANQRKVEEAKAEHQYKVAKEKCDAQKGKEESACEKDAKAQYDKARAEIKQKHASDSAGRKSATGSTASSTK